MTLLYIRKAQQYLSGMAEQNLIKQIINFAKPGSYPVLSDIESFSFSVAETTRRATIVWDNDTILAYVAHTQYPQQLFVHLQKILVLYGQLFPSTVQIEQDNYIVQQTVYFLSNVNHPTVNPDIAFPNNFNIPNAPINNILSQLIIDQLGFKRRHILFASVCVKNKFIFRFGSFQNQFLFLHRLLQIQPPSEGIDHIASIDVPCLEEQFLCMPQYEIAGQIYGTREGGLGNGPTAHEEKIVKSEQAGTIGSDKYVLSFQATGKVSAMVVHYQQVAHEFHSSHQITKFLNTESGKAMVNEQLIETRNRLYEKIKEDELVLVHGQVFKLNEFKIDQRLVLDMLLQLQNRAEIPRGGPETDAHGGDIAGDDLIEQYFRNFGSNVKYVKTEGLIFSLSQNGIGVGQGAVRMELFD